MKFKTFRIIPTLFSLDIFITKDIGHLRKIVSKRYGDEPKMWDDLKSDVVATVDSVPGENQVNDTRRIVLFITSLKQEVVVHELIHVLWHLSECCNVEMDYESQEWQAQMGEWLYTRIMDKTDYKIIR